jgi:hypothetical protein
LYHGTIDKYAYDILRNGIILDKSKKWLDFGPGFYTTSDKDFAILTAKRRQNKYNKFHKDGHVGWRVVEIECDSDKFQELNSKEFSDADFEWAKFVIANRSMNEYVHAEFDNNVDKKYDVVIGATADGGNGVITSVVHSIDCGESTMDDIDLSCIFPADNKEWNNQISFHTEKALSCLSINGIMGNPIGR